MESRVARIDESVGRLQAEVIAIKATPPALATKEDIKALEGKLNDLSLKLTLLNAEITARQPYLATTGQLSELGLDLSWKMIGTICAVIMMMSFFLLLAA